MIVIVDYGLGNLSSIQNMLRKVGYKSVISNQISTIKEATKLILPGVGAFDQGIKNLHNMGLWDILNQKASSKVPILGICLGMQLMTQKSEEGKREGLGWIDAKTIKFNFSDDEKLLKIPHMGWNIINIKQDNGLFRNWSGEARFYFVHSYYVQCKHKSEITASFNYGDEFTASFQKGNIHGVQFHPEKSHKFGMKILKAFSEI